MILKFIEVRDFLSHELERITLPERGVIQLAGNSGSGKSSLICDAVGFALFGYSATRAARADDLRRLDAPGPAFGVTIALVADDGTTYEINRGVDEDGRAFARLRSDRGHHAEGITTVKEQLRTLIGTIDPKVYHRAFVTRQDDMSALTEMDGSKRRDFIHRMLGIDALDAVGKRLRAGEREQGALLAHLQEQVGTLTEPELIAERDRAAGAEQDARTERDTRALRAREIEAQVADAETRIAPLRAARERIGQARTAIAVAEARRADIEDDQARLTRELEPAQRARSLAARHDEALAERDALRERLAGLQAAAVNAARRAALSGERETLLSERAQAEGVIGQAPSPPAQSAAEWSQLLAELLAEHRSLNDRIGELDENRRALEEKGVCSLCLRAADGHEHDTLQRLFTEQREKLWDRREQVEQEGITSRATEQAAAAAEAAIAAAERARARAAEIDERLGLIDREIAALGTEPGGGDADADQIRRRLDEADELVARITSARAWLADQEPALLARRAQNATSLAGLEGQIIAASQLIDTAGSIDDLDERERALERLREERLEVQRVALVAETALVQAASERAVAERALSDYLARRSELERAQADVARHRELGVLTVAYRKHLVAELRPQLQETTSEVMTALSAGRHPAIRISEDYEIELHDPAHDGWLAVRMISGGEKTRANFALRLALTRLVSQRTGCPIRYLVMDEIFGSQDPGHRAKMLEVLRQVQTFYPQVFLISHVGDLRERAACDWVVEVRDGQGPGRARLVSA